MKYLLARLFGEDVILCIIRCATICTVLVLGGLWAPPVAASICGTEIMLQRIAVGASSEVSTLNVRCSSALSEYQTRRFSRDSALEIDVEETFVTFRPTKNPNMNFEISESLDVGQLVFLDLRWIENGIEVDGGIVERKDKDGNDVTFDIQVRGVSKNVRNVEASDFTLRDQHSFSVDTTDWTIIGDNSFDVRYSVVHPISIPVPASIMLSLAGTVVFAFGAWRRRGAGKSAHLNG
ncbi:MAG: hypothetical protein ABJQ34_14620 [Paracoccaceae bacterium]